MGHASQLSEYHAATVLVKAGKQTLERTKHGRLVVCDGFFTDWVVLYDHAPAWTADGVFRFNLPIRRKLNQLAGNKGA